MKNYWKLIKRYIKWKIVFLGRPPYFPFWCYIEGNQDHTKKPRHVIGTDDAIVWHVEEDENLPHVDHIEMSGYYVATIISYGVDRYGKIRLNRHIAWPMLRRKPNWTRSHLKHNFDHDQEVKIYVNNDLLSEEYPNEISIRGHLHIVSRTKKGVNIARQIQPAVQTGAVIEKITISNVDDKTLDITLKLKKYGIKTLAIMGVYGAYSIKSYLVDARGNDIKNGILRTRLEKGEEKVYHQIYMATKEDESFSVNVLHEMKTRARFVDTIFHSLQLETPEEMLNVAFNHAKLRASESIFKTKNGWMHCPGGGGYYSAMWTNDQCEYVNPFFPFLGYDIGNKQSINGYKLFCNYMDKDYKKPLPASIIAEGDKSYSCAGDRGDAAMFAYGAARFCLAYGDKETAKSLWEGIRWTIEYSIRKINEEGVVTSDSDELENRFRSGKANLFTSCLLYDALLSASMLAKELGYEEAVYETYIQQAKQLDKAIESYFGGQMGGYDTYQYYKGNRVLRAWICIPLAMGILTRAKGTIKALFSHELWTSHGLRTKAGCDTFWDRSTLYALRGVFMANETDEALRHFMDYTKKRLLGEHVPYPVEAYPEGNQKHLSAESGLYTRVITEGLFDIRPTGFKQFRCNPHLPKQWDTMALRHVRLCQSDFDIKVHRVEGGRCLVIVQNGEIIYNKQLPHNQAFEIKMG